MGSMPESEGEDSADRVYMKLKACCDLAAQTLPPVRAELFARKTNADNTGHPQSSHRYAQAVNKCDFMLATNSKLLSRLKVMRVGDPARYQHEIRMLTEGFAKVCSTLFNPQHQRIANVFNRTGRILPVKSWFSPPTA